MAATAKPMTMKKTETPVHSQILITPREASRFLGVATHTLAIWRVYKKNLPFVKVGGRIRYLLSDIDSFIANGKTLPIDKKAS